MGRLTPTGHTLLWIRSLTLAALVVLAGCDDLLGKQATEDNFDAAEEAFETGNFEDSLIRLKSFIQAEPKNPKARLLLGRVYFETYDYENAEKEFRRARDFGAKPKTYVRWLGETWLRTSKADRILDEFSTESFDNNVGDEVLNTVLSLRAKAHLQYAARNRDADSLDLARQEVAQMPGKLEDNPVAQAALGQIEFISGNVPAAEEYVKNSLALMPTNFDALVLDGDLKLGQNKPSEAAEQFRAALVQEPNHPLVMRALAWALLADRRQDEAITVIDDLLAAAPSDSGINYMRALIALQNEELDIALRYAQEAINADNHLQSHFVAGAASYGLDQLEQAHDYVQSYLSRVPKNAEARKLMAAISLRLGLVTEAAESLSNVEASSPDDTALYTEVANAVLASGNATEGRVLLAAAQSAGERSSPALTRLGLAAMRAGNLEQAIKDLEEAIELDRGNVDAYSYLITAHLSAGRPAEALKVATRMQRELPDHPTSYILEGIVSGLSNDVFKAREAFEKALELEPGQPEASANLAALALIAGDRDEARRLYDDVLAKHTTHAPTYIAYAKLEIGAGELDKALDHLRRAHELVPESGEASRLLGGLLIDRNAPVEALEVTEAAMAANRDDAGLHLVRGKALLFTGQLARAVDSLETLRSLRPQLVGPNLYLAYAYERTGDLRQAVRAIDRALESSPENDRFKFEKARLQIRRGELEDARTLIVKLTRDNPESSLVAELEANLALAEGDADFAVKRFKDAQKTRETSFLNLQLAKALAVAGRTDESLKAMSSWLERYPEDVVTRTFLAGTYFAQGRHAEARPHYQELVRLRPDDVSSHNNIAWLSYKLNDLELALKHGEEARRLLPDNAEVADTLGVIYFALGRDDEAKDLLFAARQAAPGNPAIATHLAQVLMKQGDTERAADLLRSALKSEQPFGERQLAEELLNQIGG